MNKRRILLCIAMIILVSLGASLTLKAEIGVGAWDALAQSGSFITKIKVGSVGMIFNLVCVFIEFLILRKNFKIKHLLQIGLSILLGYTINFFYYDLFGNLVLSAYYARVIVLIIGYCINAFVVAILMQIDVVTFALEGACMAICDKYELSFPKFRQGVDVVCIVLVAILTFLFPIPLSVREGTVIGMIIFGPLMGVFMKYTKPFLKKYEFVK